MDPGYKKIIPSQSRGLGALLAPQSGPGAKPLEARNNTVLVLVFN